MNWYIFMDIVPIVIGMDNHMHVLWEQLKMNGKETPKESFEKFTGHMFVKKLKPDKKNLKNMQQNRKTGIIYFGKETR
jgi:putative transposase